MSRLLLIRSKNLWTINHKSVSSGITRLVTQKGIDVGLYGFPRKSVLKSQKISAFAVGRKINEDIIMLFHIFFRHGKTNIKWLVSSPSVDDMLFVWDQILSKEGAKLIRKRREFVSRLAPLAAEVHYGLSGSRERLSVRYVTGIEGETQSEIAENYAKALLSSREKDLSLRHTSVGAQRDDVRLSLGQESEENVDVRIYGSRGQQRTAALALKIAETRVMREVTGDYPTLLLDDVLSELDEARQKRLLSLGGGVQIILTSANPVSQTDRGRIFRVESGRISPQQP